MIAYEELVVALTNWRTNQGLPTSAVTFLSQDTGSVDLALPVADPLAVAEAAQELSADDLAVEGEEAAVDGFEEISAEEYADEVIAEDFDGEAAQEAPPEAYAAEEAGTDVYAAEGSSDEAISEAPLGLDYEDDTQYAGAPENFAEPGIDQTQEMTIDSVTGEGDEGDVGLEGNADENGPATEEVPMLTDEDAEQLEAQAAAELPVDDDAAFENAEVGDIEALDEGGEVEFGESEEDLAEGSGDSPTDPPTELSDPEHDDSDAPEELEPES